MLGHVGSVTMNDDSSVLRKKKTTAYTGSKEAGTQGLLPAFLMEHPVSVHYYRTYRKESK